MFEKYSYQIFLQSNFEEWSEYNHSNKKRNCGGAGKSFGEDSGDVVLLHLSFLPCNLAVVSFRVKTHSHVNNIIDPSKNVLFGTP